MWSVKSSKPCTTSSGGKKARAHNILRCNENSWSSLYRCCNPKCCIRFHTFEQRWKKQPFTSISWFAFRIAFIARLSKSTKLSVTAGSLIWPNTSLKNLVYVTSVLFGNNPKTQGKMLPGCCPWMVYSWKNNSGLTLKVPSAY